MHRGTHSRAPAVALVASQTVLRNRKLPRSICKSKWAIFGIFSFPYKSVGIVWDIVVFFTTEVYLLEITNVSFFLSGKSFFAQCASCPDSVSSWGRNVGGETPHTKNLRVNLQLSHSVGPKIYSLLGHMETFARKWRAGFSFSSFTGLLDSQCLSHMHVGLTASMGCPRQHSQ